MKRFYFLLCIGLSLSFSSGSGMNQVLGKQQLGLQFDQITFKRNVACCGSKAANLDALKVLAQWYNQTKHDFVVIVPELVWITSQDIQAFLAQQNVDVQKSWYALVQKYYPTQQDRLDAIAKGSLSQEFLQEVGILAQQVLTVFTSAADEKEKEPQVQTSQGFLGMGWIFSPIYNYFSPQKLDVLGGIEVASFIEQAQKNNKILIVRSTGKEDTEEVSNAGGNESKPNIKPNRHDLLINIGGVAASYLKPKSLMQRADAHDATLFDAPFTPVLIQHMIGEPQGGLKAQQHHAIPRCGVLYTREQRGNTPGVIHIEATYGNNEAVVNPVHQTQIGLDSYFIGQSGLIHASIKPKYKRLVPVDDVLDYVDNPGNLIFETSLSQVAVQQLHLFAQAVEAYYGSAQDVEFVLDQSIKTIYIVQSRPHQKKTFEITPQYLTSIKDIPNECMLAGASNILGDCKIGIVTDPGQIIIATTLADALETYNDINRPKHPAGTYAIVEHATGQLSHEAAICNSENIKTIATPDKTIIETWLKEPKLHLVIDIQRGVVVNAKNIECFVGKTSEQLIDSGLVKNGWLNHPIDIQASLLPWNTQRACGGLLEQILPQFPSDLTGNNLPVLSDQEIAELFEILKECPTDQIQGHLVTLLSHAYALLYQERQCLVKTMQLIDEKHEVAQQQEHQSQKHERDEISIKSSKRRKIDIDQKQDILGTKSLKRERDQDDIHVTKKRRMIDPWQATFKPTLQFIHQTYAQKFGDLFQLMLASANELATQTTSVNPLNGSRSLSSLEARGMPRLYPLKQLENLFMQLSGKCDTTLGVHSLASISKERTNLTSFIHDVLVPMINDGINLDHLLNNPALLPIALLGVQAALCPSTEQAWIMFVNHVCSDPELLGRFTTLFECIKKINVTPWWINLSFALAYKKHSGIFGDLNLCLTELEQEYNDSALQLAELQSLQQICLQQDLTAWQNPESNQKLWDVFVQSVQQKFLSGIFADTSAFAQLSPLARCATVSAMNLFVDTFDAIIKSVKGSRQYSSVQAQVSDVKRMVQAFFELVGPWAKLAPADSIQYDLYYPLDRYVATIQEIIKSRPVTDDQLTGSRGFDNMAASLGSTTNLERHLPGTIEDCFTTAHQSLLNILSALMRECGENLEIPEKLEAIDQQIGAIGIHTPGGTQYYSRMSCVGLSFEGDAFSLLYNIPLRNHSGQFKVTMHKNANYIALECRIFSIHTGRMEACLDHLKLFCLLEEYAITEESTSGQGMRCTFHIPLDAPVQFVKEGLFTLLNGTFEQGITEDYIRAKMPTFLSMSEKDIKRILDKVLVGAEFCEHMMRRIVLVLCGGNSDKVNAILHHLQSSITEERLHCSYKIISMLVDFDIELENIDECLRITELALQKSNGSWGNDQSIIICTLRNLIIKRYGKQGLIDKAEEYVKEGTTKSICDGLKLLDDIISESEFFEAIFGMLTKLSVSVDSDNEVVESMCRRIEILFEYQPEKIADLAASLALKSCKNGDGFRGIKILEALITKRWYVNEAIDAAKTLYESKEAPHNKGFRYAFANKQREACDFFRTLLNNGYGFEAVAQVIDNDCDNANITRYTTKLWTLLSKQKYPLIFDLAKKLLLSINDNPSYDLKYFDFTFCTKLIEKKTCIDQALALARRSKEKEIVEALYKYLYRSNTEDESPCILELALILYSYEKGDRRALSSGATGLFDLFYGEDLFRKLFKSGRGFKEALLIDDEDLGVRIYKEVFKGDFADEQTKLQAIKQVLQAAQEVINGVDIPSASLLGLFKKLVHVHVESHSLALALLSGHILNARERDDAIWSLLDALLEQKISIDTTIQAINMCITHSKVTYPTLMICNSLMEKEDISELSIQAVKAYLAKNFVDGFVIRLLQKCVDQRYAHAYSFVVEVAQKLLRYPSFSDQYYLSAKPDASKLLCSVAKNLQLQSILSWYDQELLEKIKRIKVEHNIK